uniref:Ubiquitin-activating enzyme E1 C-terminal domain-containing protein n=1 Tax=viral metagenome TaxID=1070528 RepID=A0A6C0H836_9ZZZZ
MDSTNILYDDLYDRQIRTYGHNVINKIHNSSILILGLENKYIYEISRLLILSNINKIYLYNPINKPFNKNNLEDLLELNINIKIVTNYKQDQHITIIINQLSDYIIEINNYTRIINSKLIVLFSYNIGGHIFVDAGSEHIINDINGEIIDNVQLKSISINGLVTSIENHNFQTNDKIILENIEGENIDFLQNSIWIIEVLTKNIFKLNNFNIKEFKFINGTAVYIKQSITINHSPFNNKLLNIIEINNLEIMPVVSILSGIIVSEVIKLITNKYYPINQWFNWEDKNIPNIVLQNEIKLLIIGMGAIGCEHLKNLISLGINNIIITDSDTIEKSNLSRQYLFREKDIGKMKSITAANFMKNKYSNINIEPLTLKAGYDNINFKEMNLTGILTAVDNNEARRFMDDICLELQIPMFDSGTEGMKGSSQPIIPFITETWSNTKDSEDKTYPICTIKAFPYNNIHTIYWALDKLHELFTEKKITALEFFNENYNINIKNLLIDHPEHDIEFWSSGKKCPKPIEFDINNKLHNNFLNIYNELIVYDLIIFDKENKKHVEWIMYIANIRELNYNIKLSDFYITKGIAGKIIPAIPTTTAIVSGLIIIEVLKYLHNIKITNINTPKNILYEYKSNFINLAMPIIIDSIPINSQIIKINNMEINIWHKFIFNKDVFLNEFKKYYDDLFNIHIMIILFDNEPIFIESIEEDNIMKKISQITNNKNIKVNMNSIEIIELPIINIIL